MAYACDPFSLFTHTTGFVLIEAEVYGELVATTFGVNTVFTHNDEEEDDDDTVIDAGD